jgi:hypothetical protein
MHPAAAAAFLRASNCFAAVLRRRHNHIVADQRLWCSILCAVMLYSITYHVILPTIIVIDQEVKLKQPLLLLLLVVVLLLLLLLLLRLVQVCQPCGHTNQQLWSQ